MHSGWGNGLTVVTSATDASGMEGAVESAALDARDAKLEQVTVYARGARVRRVTTITGGLPHRRRITGLPLSVIDGTVRVELTGPGLAMNVRVGLEAPDAPAATEQDPALRAARRELALADAEVARITVAIERSNAAQVVEQDPSAEPPAAWAAVVTARRTVI